MSNFLKYSSLIPRLAEMFPDIDFVFRPHPLLFTVLLNNGLWTQQQIDEYLRLLKEKGIAFSDEGDYLQLFADCDAMINDCGSFTVEWLYTGKPGCFVYNPSLKEGQLTTLMKKSISAHQVARSEDDIISFVRSIAQSSNTAPPVMQDWVRENIAIGYPDVSKKLLDELYILRENNNE